MSDHAFTLEELNGPEPLYPVYRRSMTEAEMQEYEAARARFDAWHEARKALEDEIAAARYMARSGVLVRTEWERRGDPRYEAWREVHEKRVQKVITEIGNTPSSEFSRLEALGKKLAAAAGVCCVVPDSQPVVKKTVADSFGSYDAKAAARVGLG